MLTNNLSVSYTHVIASSDPIGRSPVGEEDVSLKSSSFKPVEQIAELERAQPTPGDQMSLERKAQNLSSPSESDGRVAEEQAEKEQLRRDQKVISQLSARDREVRAHEQAHVSAGGQYAGAARFQYERGPDGVNYAVGGEVSIDVSKEATPEQNLLKAQVIRRAALAPADPSPQDRRVAAAASRMEAQARQEIAVEQRQEASEKSEEASESGSENQLRSASTSDSNNSEKDDTAFASGVGNSSPNSLGINSRLNTSIANTIFSDSRQGSLLDQLA